MSDTSESKNPFNKWWFISGGLVLVIAAALVWILVIGPGTANNNDDDALPEPGNSSSALPEEPSSSTKPTELAGGDCDLDDSDQEIPTAAPDAEWVDYGPLKLPTSTTIGPDTQDGAVWSCFAHTPAGALFAASYFTIGLGWNEYEAVAAAGVIANSGREAWLGKRAEQGDVTIAPGEAPAIAGFRFEAYDGTEATVQIGMRYGELERMVRVFLVWDTTAGDWKVDASKGDPTSVTNEVTSIANFTPWGVTYG